MMKGIVVRNTGSWYVVEDCNTAVLYDCRVRGKLRLKDIRTTNPISVGDIVVYELEGTDQAATGVITAIEPRRNYIIRRSTNLSKESHIIGANIDTAFLVVTLDFPATSNEFIDRFLVTCQMYHVPVVILLNKMDLFEGELFRGVVDEFCCMYKGAGYDVVEVSAKSGSNISVIKSMIQGKVSLFSGNSGVGKSTLISRLCDDDTIKTGDISDYHHKGKHTTTFSTMYKLNEGGYIIDTPGIKGFGMIDIDCKDVGRYFPDLFRLSPECKFYNCAHTHEPHCAVKSAIERGEVSAERYSSYLKILDQDDKYRK